MTTVYAFINEQCRTRTLKCGVTLYTSRFDQPSLMAAICVFLLDVRNIVIN